MSATSSIRHRLPLLICGLLAVILGVFTFAVYRQIPREATAHELVFGFVALDATLLAMAAIATAIATAIASRRLAGPLAELAIAAEAVSRGDYTPRVVVDRRDEVGTLASAFNHMASRLAEDASVREDALRALRDSEQPAEEPMPGDIPSRLVAATAVTAVTEDAHAQDEARRAQERLAHAIVSSRAVVYQLRVEESVATIDWMSENVTNVFGYRPSEGLTRGWWAEHVHPDDLPGLIQSTATTGFHDGTREYRFRTTDGAYRWVRDDQRVVRRDLGDRTVEVVGTWLDITEQRDLEEQVRQAQKMEAVGRLAGGVAHDFNNLLTVIIAGSDAEALDDGASPAVRESMQDINKAARRAATLTRQLLTFSRRQLVQPVSLDLNEAVANVRTMLRRMIGEDVDLVIHLGEGIGYVQADAGQIEQVLANLVVNARDAMPEGGTVFIETSSGYLDQSYASRHADVTPGAYVILAVSDTGLGMTEEVRAHLFEPFFTTKERGKGTGLGLATCYSIVRQFGGHIVVDSEIGAGTTMRAYFPRIDSQPLRVERPGSETVSGGHETILLVEDDPMVRRMTAKMLHTLGYGVAQASDGEEALALLENRVGAVDLLLTDVVLPKLGGRELADRMRALDPGLRVLFMSGYSDDVILKNRVFERSVRLLQKPFSREVLAAKVREALEEKAEGT